MKKFLFPQAQKTLVNENLETILKFFKTGTQFDKETDMYEPHIDGFCYRLFKEDEINILYKKNLYNNYFVVKNPKLSEDKQIFSSTFCYIDTKTGEIDNEADFSFSNEEVIDAVYSYYDGYETLKITLKQDNSDKVTIEFGLDPAWE